MKWTDCILGMSLAVLGCAASSQAFGVSGEPHIAYSPGGLYGEFTMEVNEHYSLFRDQSGILVSYQYTSASDCVFGSGSKVPSRDTVQQLNAQLVATLIDKDKKAFTPLFAPSDYRFPGTLTPEILEAGFKSFCNAFDRCSSAIVVGDVVCKDRRTFVVKVARSGAAQESFVAHMYEQFQPDKWRFARQITDTRYSPVFSNALTGPPLDVTRLPVMWIKDYVTIPLPQDDPLIMPAKEILFKAQCADKAETGKKIQNVLEGFLAATRTFPDDNKTATEENWRNLAATVSNTTVKEMRERYEKDLTQGLTGAEWKKMMPHALRAYEKRRFVIDCERMAYLLCLDDLTQGVGCVSFLKASDGTYRICNLGVAADFMELFNNEAFCAQLREKLLAIPADK